MRTSSAPTCLHVPFPSSPFHSLFPFLFLFFFPVSLTDNLILNCAAAVADRLAPAVRLASQCEHRNEIGSISPETMVVLFLFPFSSSRNSASHEKWLSGFSHGFTKFYLADFCCCCCCFNFIPSFCFRHKIVDFDNKYFRLSMFLLLFLSLEI